MKIAGLCLTIFCLASASALAATRTSASYSLTTETTDFGGRRATSHSYQEDGSSNLTGGRSTVANPVEFARTSYAGQLYEVKSLIATASAPGMVMAWQVLDDGSLIGVPATENAFAATGLALGPITLGFAPAPGQVLTLVHSTTSIGGTFADLPQGSSVTLNYQGIDYHFILSYTGGTGSDITLTNTARVPAIPGWAKLPLCAALLAVAIGALARKQEMAAR
jgi:hypothetical protein